MTDALALVLEISRQDNALVMGIFEQKDLSPTLRHYSQVDVSNPEIDKLCQEVISVLNRPDNIRIQEIDSIKSLKKIGQLLWDNLITRSVKERLRLAQISDLILSLDEELIHIPWELLFDGENFLCLKFNLGRLIRTRQTNRTLQYRGQTSKPKMLILANPTGDLKSAYLEGIYIKNKLDKKRNQISIDFKSTHIDTLYVKKNLRDYDIVHFAGHCQYDRDEPKNSGWLLCDGIFGAGDILAMSESLSVPTLIFSNACSSAEIRKDCIDFDYQEKTYSLASAFLFSGVRHYIGAIRKIEDTISLTFAQEFYAAITSGRSVGQSMRLGRLKLINEYGHNTNSWASHLLYGDPNFRLFRTLPKSVITKEKINMPYRKALVTSFLAAVFIGIFIFLHMYLPTVNPNTYFLFAKSRKLFLKGDNQEVVLLCNRVIQKDPAFLPIYPLLADTCQRQGDRRSALKHYFDYARYSEKRGDKKHLRSAYIGIGWVYHLQGEYPKALDFYNKALLLSKESLDKSNEADVLGKLAIWHMDKNDNDKALELLTKSSQINRDRLSIYKHRYNLACDYFNLGLLFTNKDDFVTAKEFYDKSFALFDKLRLKHELSDYYFNIGEIYSLQKEFQKAMDCYTKGLRIDQAQGNKPNIASDYNMIGELYLEMDNVLEAEKYFHQAILVSKDIDAPMELASSYHNLGILYKRTEKKSKSREFLRLAQEIYRHIDTSDYQNVKEELLGLDQK